MDFEKIGMESTLDSSSSDSEFSSSQGASMSNSDAMRLPQSRNMSNSDLISQLGSSRSLPNSVRTKMEGNFGTNFSNVKIYESNVVAQHGMEAAASGNSIAFAPNKMNFSSKSGLELLGHELSHVASQAKGEVSGSGFLKDNGLEDKADREGAEAAKLF